jgi:hypothetical protein
MPSVLVAGLGLMIGAACSSSGFEGRLATLEAEEARRQAKLDSLERQITAAELRAEHAKARAEYHECKATSASLHADVTLRRARCFQEVSSHTTCTAENERNTATGAAAGCVLGLGVAILTGGAAAPAALVGCGGGAAVGHATRKKCGEVPRCASHLNDMPRMVLAEHGLAAMPTCVEPAEPELPHSQPYAITEPAEAIEPRPAAVRTVCTDQRVAWIEFSVPARKANGQTWDPRGGDPDLVYTIYVEGQKRYESETHEALKWHDQPQAEVRVAPQQQLTIRLLDSDFQTSETIAIFRAIVPADTSEALSLSVGAATAKVKFECVEE